MRIAQDHLGDILIEIGRLSDHRMKSTPERMAVTRQLPMIFVA